MSTKNFVKTSTPSLPLIKRVIMFALLGGMLGAFYGQARAADQVGPYECKTWVEVMSRQVGDLTTEPSPPVHESQNKTADFSESALVTIFESDQVLVSLLVNDDVSMLVNVGSPDSSGHEHTLFGDPLATINWPIGTKTLDATINTIAVYGSYSGATTSLTSRPVRVHVTCELNP